MGGERCSNGRRRWPLPRNAAGHPRQPRAPVRRPPPPRPSPPWPRPPVTRGAPVDSQRSRSPFKRLPRGWVGTCRRPRVILLLLFLQCGGGGGGGGALSPTPLPLTFCGLFAAAAVAPRRSPLAAAEAPVSARSSPLLPATPLTRCSAHFKVRHPFLPAHVPALACHTSPFSALFSATSPSVTAPPTSHC